MPVIQVGKKMQHRVLLKSVRNMHIRTIERLVEIVMNIFIHLFHIESNEFDTSGHMVDELGAGSLYLDESDDVFAQQNESNPIVPTIAEANDVADEENADNSSGEENSVPRVDEIGN